MDTFLSRVDWIIVALICLTSMVIGLSAAKSAGKTTADYFIGGRKMPWWLLGFSMVATTFSTDTPNLVTNLVRVNGVSSNWCWWSFLPAGMLTVFLYAKLWRRSGTITDLEFYELRYSGKTAAFLRGYRAIYFGFVFNVLIIASCNLAAIKIGGTMLSLTPIESIAVVMIITAVFSAAGGLKGVLLSDFFLFIISMIGAIAAAYYNVKNPEIGGLTGLIEKLSANPDLKIKMGVLSFSSTTNLFDFFIIPILVSWWGVWVIGVDAGGGGYLVQRMLSAKNENHAVGATMFFNISHYALRPWPWIIVALASLIIYPDQSSLVKAVGDVLPSHQIQGDVAYPLMLTKLPHGWIGVVVASLIAAYISTMSTMFNWGSGYLVNDFYHRFIRPKASDREQIWAGRICTFLLMLTSGIVAIFLDSAMENFNILISMGAGTGLIFLLRWFWWRINAVSELVAMIASFVLAIYFNVIHPRYFPDFSLSGNSCVVITVAATTICWLIAAYLGPKTNFDILLKFYAKTTPSTWGWNPVIRKAAKLNIFVPVPKDNPQVLPALSASLTGCIAIYAILFGLGELLYLQFIRGTLCILFAFVFGLLTIHFWKKISTK